MVDLRRCREPSGPRARRANRLPAPLDGAKVFFTSGGGDAIDTAAKLVRLYWQVLGQPERLHIVSRTAGYHGTMAFGTSLGGIEANRVGYGPLVPSTSQVQWDSPEALQGRDRTARRRARGGVLRRARDRRRRRAASSGGIHRGDGRDLPRRGRALRLRLGHLRLRPARKLARLRAFRSRARIW